MRTAAIYRRISADREGQELGVTRQEEDCRALAARQGLTVVEVYTDNDISASTRSSKPRPEYRRMLADARAGRFHAVLAYTSGRLTRRPREHEDLIELAEQYGVRFHYVASPDFDLNTAAGRRVARILAANDAGEAEDISERVTRAKAQTAAAGKYKGGRRPYGYEEKGITVRKTEAKTLKYMADQILTGASIRALVADLNGKGLTTSTGAPWRHDAVRAVLLRARNAGLMEHRGQVVGPAAWPAILEESRWRAVVAALTAPGRRTAWSSARVWLLSGLLRCGVCGAPCRAHRSWANGRRPGSVNYVCTEGMHVGRVAEQVDELVTRMTLARLASAELTVPAAADSTELTEARRELAEVRQRLDDLGAAFGAGAVDARQLTAGTDALRTRQTQAEAIIARSASDNALAGILGVKDVARKWAGLTLERQRAIIDSLMVVTLAPASKGRPKGWQPGQSYFDPRSVVVEWRA